ncbi:PBSX family phage terminase large subunit [Anoxybacillus ayderensis]|uniref:PBSX family phage terminase large subunit n=1 Tax=Anoxybacillus sp. ST70 TaxID=2864180 RepID=UPI00036AEB4C|nr:PBSX family phage terminase large subunit [Anoxybacillus sp. ST70]AXM89374.1 PBSX family phage terminase large subunit [Anoxybacillus ayderensis G10]THD16135.1 PBSX family phage terminase large subunit [Anoxybacillus ayderensis]
MIMEMTIKRKIRWNPIFKPVNECRKRYRVLKGSAGSGKSVNIAQDYIKKLSDPRYEGANLLVVRKVEETNRDSTFAELEAAINRMFGDYAPKVWRITRNPLQMECLITGNRIIFRGMSDARQREKVKSITFKRGKLTWIWVEEATELAEQDIDILDDRLRGELPNPNLYYQITLTFNPVSATHWIKGKYFDVVHPDIFTHHSTYLDNRFIDEAYHRRMMLRKERDPEGYRVYGLGEWGELGGLILTNYEVLDFDTSFPRFDRMTYGQDFGFNHANAILTVGFKDDEIFICDEIYVYEKDTSEVIQLAEQKGLSKKIIMYCDSAEPDRIKMWRQAGYRAYPVKKEPGSVKAQIDWLKQHKIYIHPQCVNTIKEIQQWKWKKDERTNTYVDEPVEFLDDAMAALRYSIEGMRRGPSVSILK